MMELPKLSWNQILISLLIGAALGIPLGKWQAQGDFSGRHWKKGEMKQHMLERFSRELQLNEKQKVQVSAIFENKHVQMEALREEMKPKFEALRTATQNEIRPLLTPDQQIRFDALNEEMEKRWKKRKKGF